MQIIYVKCSNYQVAQKCDCWQIKCESPVHTPTYWAKKWKRAFTPPPRETQAGEYEVTVPTMPRVGAGVSNACARLFSCKFYCYVFVMWKFTSSRSCACYFPHLNSYNSLIFVFCFFFNFFQRLLKLKTDGTELVTNVEVAADARESMKRLDEEEARRQRYKEIFQLDNVVTYTVNHYGTKWSQGHDFESQQLTTIINNN